MAATDPPTIPSLHTPTAVSSVDPPPGAATVADPGSRIRCLDGLRGAAVLAVMCYHFGLPATSGGYVGVEVFFVLSGYLISRNLVRSSDRPGWLGRFWYRRVIRLYPVLAVVMATLAAAWTATSSLDRGAVLALVGGVTMSSNLLVLVGARSAGVVHLWSLGVEWQFYVLAPALAVGFRRHLQPRRRALVLAVAAVVVIVGRLALLLDGSVDRHVLYLSTPTRLDGLLLGTALTFAPLGALRRIGSRPAVVAATVALVTVTGFGPFWVDRPTLALGFLIPLTGVSTAVLMAAALLDTLPGRLGAVLEAPPMVWAGSRSYSLYLWHYLIGVSLAAAGAESWHGPAVFAAQLGLSLLAGETSYRVVERPARLRLAARRWRLNPLPG